MMKNSSDHTKELERCISAIKIRERDYCSFYNPRENSIVAMKECWYCRYASFDFEGKDTLKHGFCNFKKY